MAAQRLLTGVVAFLPIATLAVVAAQVLHQASLVESLIIAFVFYVVIGHGITVGFHRLFTHRSFEASRPLKIVLALLGSMSFQGSVIGWVADHRRHHMFADRAGDPHSPHQRGDEQLGGWRGFWHAHMGWFFIHDSTSRSRFAADLLADRDLVIIDRLFVPCSVVSLVLPFGIGYALGGTFSAGLLAFIFAGILRVGLFHHVTWLTNSACHMFGKRPFRTRDRSTNLALLAVLSMGESWHNGHHAFPSSARHGVNRFQIDTSAMVIRAFELLGWATRVHWPEPLRVAARRQRQG